MHNYNLKVAARLVFFSNLQIRIFKLSLRNRIKGFVFSVSSTPVYRISVDFCYIRRQVIGWNDGSTLPTTGFSTFDDFIIQG